jgi:hypothetical protein
MCYAWAMALGRVFLGTVVGLSLASAAAQADDAPARIGRIAAIAGPVQYRAPAGEWSNALVNEPVGTGVGVRSPRAATAELRIAGDRVALAGASEVQLLRLDRDLIEIALVQGRIGIHLDRTTAATVEVDLPGGGAWLTAPGDYDIAAGDEQHPARIEVLAGKALLGGGLDAGNLAAAAPGSFDASWRSDIAEAPAQVSPNLTGAEMLAANGTWETDDTFGSVWYPKNLPEGWAPYRVGRWRYLTPWGWTWIDAAEWGFAPSHYGGWERIGERWAWIPGQRDADSSYSPARIAFLGTGGIGLSRPGNDGAAVGWFPLAPGETTGDASDAHFRNRRAASVVPRAVFAGGQPVQSTLLDLPEWRLDNAPVIVGELGIPPVGIGGTGYVAGATAPQVTPERVVSVPLSRLVSPLASPMSTRQLALARIQEVLAHAVRKRLAPSVLSSPHHQHAALAIVRPRAAPSTIATHSTHNHPHLAAARGGAY